MLHPPKEMAKKIKALLGKLFSTLVNNFKILLTNLFVLNRDATNTKCHEIHSFYSVLKD